MQLGWIDFSRQDKADAINIINSMKEKGVLDELGFGALRQAFANCFFPGTSTIQTRAKYFFIVSYILQDFISSVSASENDFQKFIANSQNKISGNGGRENRVGKLLVENAGDDERLGIIGSRSIKGGKWVERTPLSIYWNGLRTFQFFQSANLNFTYADFMMRVFTFARSKAESKAWIKSSKKDDGDDFDAGNFSKISPLARIETYSKTWEKDIQITLSKKEAELLESKIVSSVPESLLAFLLKNKIDISSCRNDFELFTKLVSSKANPDTVKKLDLANKANEFYYLTMLRYSFLLSKGVVSEIADEWENTWGEKNRICNEFDIEATFKTMNIQNPRLKIFLFKLQKSFLDNDLDSCDEIIRNREKELKGNRAKLTNSDYELTEMDSRIFRRFDYRLSNAAAIINDIYQGEKQC